MLQPLQLQEVSARYPNEIAELRDFLAKTGLPLGAADTLGALTARLREDRTFRRDLISSIWVVLDAHDGHTSPANLLAILALAAAGPAFAAAADEFDAHTLLRFLMEARRSFSIAAGPLKRPAAVPPAPIAATVASFPAAAVTRPGAFAKNVRQPAPEDEDGPLFANSDPEDTTDPRKRIAMIAVACVLASLLLFLFFHHRSAPASNSAALATRVAEPPTSTASTNPPAPAPTTQPATAPAPHLPASIAPRRSTHPRALPPARPAAARTPRPLVLPAAPADDDPELSHAQPAPTPAQPAPSHASAAPNTPAPRPTHKSYPTTSTYIPNRTPIPSPTPATAGSAAPTRQGYVRSTSLGTMAANVLYSPAPAYPAAAAAEHIQGEVKLEAEIDRDGNVLSTRVISGPPLLREAAANAVQQWRYRPYLANGRPIGTNAEVVMDFQLP